MSARTRTWSLKKKFFRFWRAGSALVLALVAVGRSEEKAFDLFPMSKPWRDVRIPRYDDHDVLTSMMHTEALTRQDEKKLKLDGLTLVMFQSSGDISLRLKTKQGIYDVGKSMLQTHSTTFIEHAQFEMTGDRLTFDTAKQQGTLQGNVEMRIFGIPVAPEAPSAQPAVQPASGEKMPVPQPQSQPKPQAPPDLQNVNAAAKAVEVVQAHPSSPHSLAKLSKP